METVATFLICPHTVFYMVVDISWTKESVKAMGEHIWFGTEVKSVSKTQIQTKFHVTNLKQQFH